VAELITYQFGVEVSRSWLYRLLGRAVTPLTVFGAAVLAALSTLVVVGPDEQGIVARFGAVRGPALPPGIHLKWPWPVETAASYPVGRVLEVTVSSDLAERPADEAAILWTGGDDNLAKLAMEYYPTSLGGGGGMGLVAADVVVQFRVRDLLEFLSGSLVPKEAVAVITHQEASRYFATHDLDHLLTAGRTEGGAELERTIQERSDALGLGLDIVGVSITSLKPPGGRVARAFHRQIGAQQERETLIQKGHRDAVVTLAKVAGSVDHAARINDAILELDAYRSGGEDEANLRRIAGKELDIEALLGEARGEAAELVHAARGYRWTRSVGERSARERFAGELLAYEQAPAYYRMKRFFEVLATGLADRRKFVIAGDPGDRPVLRMDFNDSATAIDTLLGK
jgi:regulator of protease activity HflC (stomatin/prohibitin superfamily)